MDLENNLKLGDFEIIKLNNEKDLNLKNINDLKNEFNIELNNSKIKIKG
jgi:hypothetical protein